MAGYEIEIQEPGEEPGEVPDVGLIKIRPLLKPHHAETLASELKVEDGTLAIAEGEISVIGIEPIEPSSSPWDEESNQQAIAVDLIKRAREVGETLVSACGVNVVYGASIQPRQTEELVAA